MLFQAAVTYIKSAGGESDTADLEEAAGVGSYILQFLLKYMLCANISDLALQEKRLPQSKSAMKLLLTLTKMKNLSKLIATRLFLA